jgi:hypothetical protein
MFPLFDQLSDLCSQYAILMCAETEAEARKTADNHDIDWQGYNRTDNYSDVSDAEEVNLGGQGPDPRNGHLKDTAAAARSSKQHSKQQRRKFHAKQWGAAGRGSSSSGNSSGGSSKRVAMVVAISGY